MDRINSLTGLRFLAAFMVVGSHFFSFQGGLDFLNPIFKKGHLGVEFFFILSGFVLGLRYRKDIIENHFGIHEFYLLRVARIAPVYYLSMALALPTLYLGLLQSEFLGTFLGKWIFIFSNLTFTQSMLPASVLIDHWNVPSWSLSVEMTFYLLFPILGLPLIRSAAPLKYFFFLFLVSIVCFGLASSLPEQMDVLGVNSRVLWINQPLLRLPIFLIGVLLANISHLDVIKKFEKPFFHVGLVSTLLLFTLPVPGWITSMGSPIAVISFSVLILGSRDLNPVTKVLSLPLLILLGEASYSLYILQAPLKIIFQQIYSKVLMMGETQGLAYCTYLSVTLIGTSIVSYLYFEKPVNQLLRKWVKRA